MRNFYSCFSQVLLVSLHLCAAYFLDPIAKGWIQCTLKSTGTFLLTLVCVGAGPKLRVPPRVPHHKESISMITNREEFRSPLHMTNCSWAAYHRKSVTKVVWCVGVEGWSGGLQPLIRTTKGMSALEPEGVNSSASRASARMSPHAGMYAFQF